MISLKMCLGENQFAPISIMSCLIWIHLPPDQGSLSKWKLICFKSGMALLKLMQCLKACLCDFRSLVTSQYSQSFLLRKEQFWAPFHKKLLWQHLLLECQFSLEEPIRKQNFHCCHGSWPSCKSCYPINFLWNGAQVTDFVTGHKTWLWLWESFAVAFPMWDAHHVKPSIATGRNTMQQEPTTILTKY